MATTSQRKLGVLVAIPIKGRKLVNKSGGKQSPYVQLRLGDQNKRTRASLIAAAEPEWDQEARSLFLAPIEYCSCS
jgi:topoisomerase IA-like protein